MNYLEIAVLVVLVGGVAAAVGFAIALGGRARRRKTTAFHALGAALDLHRAPLAGRLLRTIADHSLLGGWQSVPVVVQYCEGAGGRPVRQMISGIEIDMETGVIAAGGWHMATENGRAIFVEQPDKPSGIAAEQRAALCKLHQTGRYLLLAGIPFASLMPGSRLDLVVRSEWPDGWNGLVLRGVLPLAASAAEVGMALDELAGLRRQLRGESQPNQRGG